IRAVAWSGDGWVGAAIRLGDSEVSVFTRPALGAAHGSLPGHPAESALQWLTRQGTERRMAFGRSDAFVLSGGEQPVRIVATHSGLEVVGTEQSLAERAEFARDGEILAVRIPESEALDSAW